MFNKFSIITYQVSSFQVQLPSGKKKASRVVWEVSSPFSSSTLSSALYKLHQYVLTRKVSEMKKLQSDNSNDDGLDLNLSVIESNMMLFRDLTWFSKMCLNFLALLPRHAQNILQKFSI